MARRDGESARPMVDVADGRKVLRVGGIIQSVHVDERHVPDIWDAMLPAERPARVLILGLGGGTMATLLANRWGDVPIVGVEHDPAVIWLARTEFGLDALPNVEIVHADAFAYVQTCRERFDAICVDLYTAGRMAHGVLNPSFLRQIARLLTPEGEATFNLWRSPYLKDQLRRLGRTLTVRRVVEIEDNVVACCGHRPAAPAR